MHYLIKTITLMVLLSVPLVSFSQNESCTEIQSYKQIIQCAQSQAPQIQNADAELQVKKSSLEAAGQWRNPNLTLEKFSDTDLALQFPIGLGGMRAARIEMAGSEQGAAEGNLMLIKSEVQREVRLKLERLRQVNEELALAEESLQTFTKLVKQYEGRPTLSAEQRVSLNVFKLAKGDYIFRKVEQEEELYELEIYFQVNLGLTLGQLKKIKLSKMVKWPILSEATSDLSRSAYLATFQNDFNIARASVSAANAQAWPEISVGPSLKILGDQSSGEKQQWGMNLSFTLPLFNLNQGGKRVANQSLQAADLKRQLAEKNLKAQRDSLIKQYRKSVLLLESSDLSKSMEEKHQQIESLFVRGVVSSSLIIEAHRSLVDFERARNARILKALSLYLTLQFIDGQEVGEL